MRGSSPYHLRGTGLRIPAGTLATPALRFGRERTGIYRAGAGRWGIGVGGFRALELTANDLFVRSNNTGNVQPLSIARANATTADGQETSVDFYEIASVVGRMSLYRQASTIMGFKWYGYSSGLHGTPAMTLSGDKDLTVGRDLIVVRNIAAAAIGASAGLSVSAGAVSLPAGSLATAALAANAVTKVGYTTKASAVNISATNVYADVLTLAFTSSGGDLLIIGGDSFYQNTPTPTYYYMSVRYDSVADSDLSQDLVATASQSATIVRYLTGVPSGAHTIALRSKCDGSGSVQSYISYLLVLELKK